MAVVEEVAVEMAAATIVLAVETHAVPAAAVDRGIAIRETAIAPAGLRVQLDKPKACLPEAFLAEAFLVPERTTECQNPVPHPVPELHRRDPWRECEAPPSRADGHRVAPSWFLAD